jgi:proteasome lid subunit RPN8/RPN11
MPETSLEQEHGCWSASECSLQIEYSSPVLADLDRDAIEGFHRLKRGGVEVGGVLLGTKNDRTVTILDYRPFHCEHALGPDFVLSGRDHEALAALLESLRADPKLQVVGWYHSNNRSHIHLSRADLEVFDRRFPEPWQIALLLKPDSFAPTKAEFFVREEDGSIRADSSHREFSLQSQNDPDRKTDRDMLIERAAMSRSSFQLAPQEPPKSALRKPVLISALGAWAMALVVIGFHEKEKPRNPLALTLHDSAGQLEIGWNRRTTPIGRNPSGILEVRDGDRLTVVNLHGDQLRRGTIVYDRISPNVVVNLKVGRAEESAVFVGPPRVDVRRQERMREAADIAPQESRPPVPDKRIRPHAQPAREKEISILTRPPARR